MARREPPGQDRPREGAVRLHPDKTVMLSVAKAWLSDLVIECDDRGRRFVLTRRGRVVAALICARDLARLEAAERAAQTDLFLSDAPPASPAHGPPDQA
jgi:hypothetical protein